MKRFMAFSPTLLLLAATATARAGDTDDSPRSCRLELLPAAIGGTSGVDLRTSSPATPAVLILGASIQSLDPDGGGYLPYIRALGPGALVTTVPTNGAGRFRVLAPVPLSPALVGATLFAQALAFTPAGQPEASNVAATTVNAAQSYSFADRSFFLPTTIAGSASNQCSAHDLDLDGDPDLLIAHEGGLALFRNDGNFQFTDVTLFGIPAAAQIPLSVVEAFDADGDRDLDLFLGGGVGDVQQGPLPNLLLRNFGNLQFLPEPAFPSAAGLVRDVAVADFDRDGDLDLVLANGTDGVHAATEQPDPNVLLVNQGHAQGGTWGAFAPSAAFAAAAWNAAGAFNIAVANGDIDEDGDVDLFFARSDTQIVDGIPGQENVLLQNDGALAFSDVSATKLQPQFSDNSQGARFADFDGDGLLDLIVVNSGIGVTASASGELYRNSGGGVLVEDPLAFPQIDESEIAIRLAVHVADVDLDGDLDMLQCAHEFFDFDGSTGMTTGGDDLLFVNQGGADGGVQGTFVLAPSYTSFGIFVTPDAAFADFDLDGDDDLFIASQGGLFGPKSGDRLLENLRIP